MERDSYSDDQIRKILSLGPVAVVGMSKYTSKAAHYVPKYLHENGFEITPVNPNAETILGKKSHMQVSDIKGDVGIVNVFRPSDHVLQVVKDAIKKKPKAIWLQEGIHSPEAEDMARKAGIMVVFNRCMMVEHRRLAG